jgi:hypothetical protein
VIEHGRKVFAYHLQTDAGDREAACFLDPSWVMEHGLNVEAVLGFIVPTASIDQLAPANLRENSAFLRLLSRVIYEKAGNDPDLCLEADVQSKGHVYLLDGRTPDPAGRVAPEDIIGEVAVEAGKVVRGSFHHNPRHRLLTVNGFFRLSPTLEAALDTRLRSPTKHVWWPDEGRQLQP